MFELDQKVAVVTGAVGLLGIEPCRSLARAGARVVVTELSQDACVRAARALGGEAFPIAANLTDKDSVKSLAKETVARFGRIDILVNNAAVNDKFESPTAAAEMSKFENYP